MNRIHSFECMHFCLVLGGCLLHETHTLSQSHLLGGFQLSSDQLTDLVKELVVMQAIQHPNIVAVYGITCIRYCSSLGLELVL